MSVVGTLAVRSFVRRSVLAVERQDPFDCRIFAPNLFDALAEFDRQLEMQPQ